MSLALETDQDESRDDSFIVECQEYIGMGQQALQRVRFRLVVSIVSGALIAAILQVLLEWSDETSPCDLYRRFDFSPPQVLSSFFVGCLFYGRFICLGLAPLNDLHVTRLVLLMDCLLLVGHSLIVYGYGREYLDSAFAFCSLLIACLRQPSCMQSWMWRALSAWVAVRALIHVASICMTYIAMESPCGIFEDHSGWWGMLPANLIALYVCMRPALRREIQAALIRACEGGAHRIAAAGIAGLVGGCSADEILATAKSRFRVVDLSLLTASDLADNRPSPSLFLHSEPARLSSLHACDAFISHSWHDDAPAKWAALQRWRSSFVAQHSREPRVWLDKCCIDQTRIDDDLRCLPVFLSGCQHLVIFCGTTYLNRLWCVVELFTFAHMGKDLSRIEFVPVLRMGKEEEDREEIERSFATFDASNCSCFQAEDHAKLLGIIGAAFGSLQHFSSAVLAIFNQESWKRASLIKEGVV